MTSHVAATQPDGAELPACPLTPRVRAPRNLLFREPQLPTPQRAPRTKRTAVRSALGRPRWPSHARAEALSALSDDPGPGRRAGPLRRRRRLAHCTRGGRRPRLLLCSLLPTATFRRLAGHTWLPPQVVPSGRTVDLRPPTPGRASVAAAMTSEASEPPRLRRECRSVCGRLRSRSSATP